ncbi:MAG: beta-propeller domain-containing protein [Thermoplasmata archaeon]
MKKTWKRTVCATVVILLIVLLFIPTTTTFQTPRSEDEDQSEVPSGCLNRFSSYDELDAYVKDSAQRHSQEYQTGFWLFDFVRPSGGFSNGLGTATIDTSGGDSGFRDYSTTNIQVEGVDEPDIVKTDGRYLYLVSQGEVVIVRAYPGEDARILSRIENEFEVTEIFVEGSRLILFEEPVIGEFDIMVYWARWSRSIQVAIYDISDKSSPMFLERFSFSGHYVDSRLIGDYAYIVVSQGVFYEDEKIVLPVIENSESTITVNARQLCYFPEPAPQYSFTLVASINIQTTELNYETFLIDYGHLIYVSSENIYITGSIYHRSDGAFGSQGSEATSVHRVAIEDGRIEYAASGEVPGRVLNQFSMDEHRGYLRIATTEGRAGKLNPTSRNNVYVMDSELRVVGRLENLAPGERIYSARFMGNRCYLVTFKKVDPFFVIDLSNPKRPRVLGELKIPGFSDYLHPYDENHIIGIGKDTVEAEEGDFAWYQGIKLSLFEVTDVNRPTEISKYVIGDRGTSSEALRDHKAFLFSRSRNLLIIPILLAEINESKYPDGVPPNAFGEYVWNGAYVFSITLRQGFLLKGRISLGDDYLGGFRYNYNSYSVRRSLYIEENIYTISESMIKINQMDTLEEIKELEL